MDALTREFKTKRITREQLHAAMQRVDDNVKHWTIWPEGGEMDTEEAKTHIRNGGTVRGSDGEYAEHVAPIDWEARHAALVEAVRELRELYTQKAADAWRSEMDCTQSNFTTIQKSTERMECDSVVDYLKEILTTHGDASDD